MAEHSDAAKFIDEIAIFEDEGIVLEGNNQQLSSEGRQPMTKPTSPPSYYNDIPSSAFVTGLAGGFGGVTLKVTPAQLKSKADEVTAQIREMEKAFLELERSISRTAHYWIGEAGNHYRALYEEDKEEIELMLRRLKEHPKDLLQMAQVYEETEQHIKEISSALPEDVIS